MTTTLPASFKVRARASGGRWNVTSHDSEGAARAKMFWWIEHRRDCCVEIWRHETTPGRPAGYGLLTRMLKGRARAPQAVDVPF